MLKINFYEEQAGEIELNHSGGDFEIPPQFDPLSVYRVEADGAELSFVEMKFRNIPIRNNRTVWRDDMARFVIENLMPLTQ